MQSFQETSARAVHNLLNAILPCYLLFIPVSGDTCGAELPPAQYEPMQLREQLLNSHSRIKSIYAEHSSSEGDYSSEKFPPGTYVHGIVAMRAPNDFYQDFSHGHNSMNWKIDPLRYQAFVNEKAWVNYSIFGRYYSGGSLKSTEALPGSLNKEFTIMSTGIWLLNDRPSPRHYGQPITIPDIAQSADYSKVRSRQENCDGHWCHVLETDYGSAIWLDVGRDCIILRRVIREPSTHKFIGRHDLLDQREISSGVWFPRNIVYYKDENGTHRRATFEFRDVHVNDVSDELFQFRRLPGLVNVHNDNSAEQVVPGGLDLLNKLNEYVTKYAEKPKSSWLQLSIPKTIGLGLGLVIGTEVWVFASRRSRMIRNTKGIRSDIPQEG